MTKTKKSKLFITLISILASVFVYTGAMVVYLYANGWRVDPFNQQVLRTGVLTVESDPFLATVYVDGDSKGRTPRSTSLPVGSYDVSVYRNGYVEWRKQVLIKEEISTPVYPWLIRENIEKENVYSIEGSMYVDSWVNEHNSHILILTNSFDQSTGTYKYELWRYDVNTTFWDFSSNPKVVLTFESTTEDTKVDIDMSPSGLLGVLSYTENNVTTHYLLNTSRHSVLSDLTVLNVEQFDNYERSWSKNNQYLLFESSTDLISFNVDKQTRYLLLRKLEDKDYIWSTDEQGYFYLVESNSEFDSERVYAYRFVQEEMDGSNPKNLIADLFFQRNTQYLEKYRDDTSPLKYAPFTNSTVSTKSVGKIKNIVVNQVAQGIYIQTENASYWYNIRTKKYHLIAPYESELVQFSGDNQKLIFKDDTRYAVFTFIKENGNPHIEIGSKSINNINPMNNEISDIQWISNSTYIIYREDNQLYISDKDGDNKVKVLDDVNSYIHFGINSSRDRIFTISVSPNQDIVSIDRFNIR